MAEFKRKIIASRISPPCCRKGCKEFSTVKIEAGKNGGLKQDEKLDYAYLCEKHFEEYQKISEKEIIWLNHLEGEIIAANDEILGLKNRNNWFVTPVIVKKKVNRNWAGTDPKMARAEIVGELNSKELEKLI